MNYSILFAALAALTALASCSQKRTNSFNTLYFIRDNMFFGPDEQQSFTIPGGSRFSITLPIMTEERFPKTKETHNISIAFAIADSETK